MKKADIEWIMSTIQEPSFSEVPAYQQTVNLIDVYHLLDKCHMITEEDKFELRNSIYFSIQTMKKKTPTSMRLRLTTWMYDKATWKEEKRDILNGLTS